MMNSSVKIVIPTYKRGKWITIAIESALAQKPFVTKVIVVDDNDPDSPDRVETEATMARYSGRKEVVYLKHVKNRNGAVARNTGLAAADSEYVLFLDDDDVLLPNAIEQHLMAMESSPAAGVSIGGCLHLMNGQVVGYDKAPEVEGIIANLLAQETGFGSGSCLMFRRAILAELGGYNASLSRHQDWEAMIKVTKETSAVQSSHLGVLKRADDRGNLPSPAKLAETKAVFFQQFHDLIAGLDADVVSRVYRNNKLELAGSYLGSGNFPKAAHSIDWKLPISRKESMRLIRFALGRTDLGRKLLGLWMNKKFRKQCGDDPSLSSQAESALAYYLKLQTEMESR